jgi:hypothetical protein
LPGHSRLFGGGKVVKYGTLIAVNNPFDKQYPAEAQMLRKIHDRRNKLPSSHPYDEKGGFKNRWLKKPERNMYSSLVKTALDNLAVVVKTHIS